MFHTAFCTVKRRIRRPQPCRYYPSTDGGKTFPSTFVSECGATWKKKDSLECARWRSSVQPRLRSFRRSLAAWSERYWQDRLANPCFVLYRLTPGFVLFWFGNHLIPLPPPPQFFNWKIISLGPPIQSVQTLTETWPMDAMNRSMVNINADSLSFCTPHRTRRVETEKNTHFCVVYLYCSGKQWVGTMGQMERIFSQ